MDLTNIRPYRGGPQEAVGIINDIIRSINLSDQKPGSVLYLGHKQDWAISQIETCDPILDGMPDNFAGWPVIWVKKRHYVRLV